MTYYRIKKEFDNHERSDGSIFVQNELYTEREMQRYNVPMQYVEKVSEKKSQVYWLFGARFGSVGYNE